MAPGPVPPAPLSSQPGRTQLHAVIQRIYRCSGMPHAGLGWTPVVTLDLGDQSQFCPSPWVEINSPGRLCTARSNCEGLSFQASGVTFCRVCGRAVGYVVLSPDAFANFLGVSSDGPYLNGIYVPHGQPRQHIWSLLVVMIKFMVLYVYPLPLQ